MSAPGAIVVPDPFRPHIEITLSARTWGADGGWAAAVHVDNPGYAEAPLLSPVFSSQAQAEAWARRAVAERLSRIEETRASLALARATSEPVDLGGLATASGATVSA